MNKLLDIRWVCAVCLKVIHAPLKVTKRWASGNRIKKVTTAWGPQCHGHEMLIAGEPKVDLWGLSGQGRGALIDPVDNLRAGICLTPS